MRRGAAMAGATLVTAGMIQGWATASMASSAPYPPTPSGIKALNGSYRATSDGNWTQVNHQYLDQETVTSIWTIASTCTPSAAECSGQVTSDQGWSAPLKMNTGLWLVTHEVENYEQCPDGTVFPGHQHFKFYPTDDNNLRGRDETIGPSGACGVSQWRALEMPFTLVKIG